MEHHSYGMIPPKNTILSDRRTSGVALVIVLSILLLISVLVIAFFSSVSTELSSSQTYAAGADTRLMADSVVHLVTAQIMQATSGRNAADEPLAWASQPGMIRTWNEQGRPEYFYKLYSADQMVADGSTFSMQTEAAAWDGWHSPGRAGLYTDLNAPVLYFDPSGSIVPDPAVPGDTYSASYPIMDPTAQGLIEGFSVAAAAAGYAGTNPPAASYNPTQVPASGTANPAPMPARWIYLLQDGRMISPVNSVSGIVSFGAGGPTINNPIVGRVAFWTDDETAKININTASEGVFWDRPWAATNASSLFGERTLAGRIPARNEFQRFPGHPAATSLSTVFGGVLPVALGDASSFRNYFNLAPRVGTGGTEAGTRTPRAGGITLSQDRLYATMDEFIFNPLRTLNQPLIPATFLEKTRFFLTAQSRAPEVTMFNTPRVSLWPLQTNQNPKGGGQLNLLTSKEQMIRRAATIGEHEYGFRRLTIWDQDPAIRNSGPPPSSQSKSLDWSQIPRNREIYSYLDRLASDPIPGYGRSIKSKYPNDKQQILTSMWDQLRSGLNVFSEFRGLDNSGSDANRMFHFAPPQYGRGEGQVVPLSPAGSGAETRGFGRFPTVAEAAVMFTPVYEKRRTTGSNHNPAVDGPIQVGAVFFLNFFYPTPGPIGVMPDIRVVVEGLDSFRINNSSLGFPSSGENFVQTTGRKSGWNHYTAFVGLMGSLRYPKSDWDYNKTLGRTDPLRQYPFYGETPVDISGSQMNFTGGTITVKIYSGFQNVVSPENLLQEVRIPFPSVATPIPTPLTTNAVMLVRERNSSGELPSFATVMSWRMNAEQTALPATVAPFNIGAYRPGVVLRSMVLDAAGPTKGDYRLAAALETVPDSYFITHPEFRNLSERNAHSLRFGNNIGWEGKPSGNLIAGLTQNPLPGVPPGLNGARMNGGSLGDWDNGSGILPDGPYVNKPDGSNQDIRDIGEVGAGTDADFLGGFFTTGQSFIGRYEGEVTTSTYSPNRQAASAVLFGSLPTGVVSQRPWQTLLFNAQPAAGASHPGFANPPDHVVLDWFHMPIVEPYAISEPLSTAGKVNMNYQIAPFSYIRRNTGVRAVLKPTMMMAIPDADAATYKQTGNTANFRYPLNLDETQGTLRGFEDRFNAGEIFRSASEICEISLVPANAPGNPTYSGMENWWRSRRLTGDNARESPYNHIYPRLTTKSNVYTVHMRVQALKKSPGDPSQWREGRDQVVGEYRGSATIERYVDPNDPELPDFATDSTARLSDFYRFRTISTKQFAP